MRKLILGVMFLWAGATNAQQLLEVLKPNTSDNTPSTQGKAQVWDRTHYIPSYNHNGVTRMEGYITSSDYSGHSIKKLYIPYNEATIGFSYPAITVTRTVQDRWGGERKLTLTIPAGTFTEAKGFLKADITPDYLLDLKTLDANTEEIITTFTFNIGGGRTSTVTLIATGGVLDKKFNVETNGSLEHQFIYHPGSVYATDKDRIPDTGAPYEKKWLDQNLGANIANLNEPSCGDDPNGHCDSYGSLFEWGRDSDGHEIIEWTSSTGGTFKNPSLHNYTVPQYWTTMPPEFTDPCPTGYHTPTQREFNEVPNIRAGEQGGLSGGIYNGTLSLSTPPYRNYTSANIPYNLSNTFLWTRDYILGGPFIIAKYLYIPYRGYLYPAPPYQTHAMAIRCIGD